MLGALALRGGEEIVEMVRGDASGLRKLVEVGADHRGAGILGEVGGLGVDEDGDVAAARGADSGGAELVGERPLRIVGEDDGVDLFDEG